MTGVSVEELRKVNSFPRLIELLRDKLDWPIGEDYEFEDVVFEYEPGELNLKPEERAKVREIHQLRPLVQGQPWGIFFISFEEKSISVTVLRRLLRGLVLKNRASAREATRQAWDKRDLIFAANFGRSGERELAIVHFADEKETNDLPVLKVLGWNAKDTFLHNDHVAHVLNEKLRWPDDPDDHEEWRKAWGAAFETRHNEVIQTSKDLAIRLASLATDIRARANQLLAAEADDGAMRKMLEAFRKNLIQDLDEDGFADMFAQTIAYGLLAARISRPSGALVADNLTDMVPKTNPFLRELFETFLSLGGRDKRKEMDFDELGVRNVVDMLVRANMEAVLRDFGDRNPKEDPVIHFYELFLKEYDPQKRMQRGVFYTPRPVVNFIVRGVDEILRTEFDLPLGLADTTSWAELAARNDKITIPEHVDPDAPFVQILDPATGTGTFLVEVIDLIHKRMMEHWRAQKWSDAEIQRRWNEYVPRHLLPRLTGFELMMAPYAIAHMKIGLKLIETGYKFGSDERAHVFLTNALEPTRDLDLEFIFMAEALAHEAQAANAAKGTAFSTVIGNPPYSRESRNLTKDQRKLVSHLKSIEGRSIVTRGHLELERAVQNDYVKFIALAHKLVAKSGHGVIGFITSNSFRRAPLLAGLRYHWCKSFPEVSIVDLHGYAQGQAIDSRGDENIFEILEGVAIHFTTMSTQAPGNRVLACDMRGLREKKLDLLLEGALPVFVGFIPQPPDFRFAPNTGDATECYLTWCGLEAIMPTVRGAIVTARDKFVIDFDVAVLLKKIAEFEESSETLRIRSLKVGARWSGAWANEGKAQVALNALKRIPKSARSNFIHKLSYRPFDIRELFYVDEFLDTPARAVMASMLDDKSLGLSLGKSTRNPVPDHFLAVCHPVEAKCTESSKQCHLAPLWLSRSAGEIYHRPNIDCNYAQRFGKVIDLAYTDGISRDRQTSMGSEFRHVTPKQLSLHQVTWDGRGDLKNTLGPRDLFDWIYAVLHSPGYRTRYADFLKSDFPRIPTPGSRQLFAALVPLGAELVALHLLKPDEASVLQDPAKFDPAITFNGTGEARVERGYPKYENGKVMINATRWFEDVPRETWEFHVGGYQVCEKWLKDRAAKGGKKPKPGRILTDEDILHYRRVVVALTETRRIMVEIDRVIDEHGGWPGAFTANND